MAHVAGGGPCAYVKHHERQTQTGIAETKRRGGSATCGPETETEGDRGPEGAGADALWRLGSERALYGLLRRLAVRTLGPRINADYVVRGQVFAVVDKGHGALPVIAKPAGP